MPDGRFLSKSIAYSAQVAAVSLEADYLFMRMIPHLDSKGRIVGEPAQVKALVCPLRDELSPAIVERCLSELCEIGLILWYSHGSQRYVAFPGFTTHQRGARLEREAPSRLPAPPKSGKGPDQLRTNSGPTPDLLRVSEVKRSEVKLSEGTASPDVDRVLAHYVACHPRRRPGSNDRSLVQRRLKAGISVDTLCDAITGNKNDPWHAAKKKHELGYVLREGKLYDFAEKAQAIREAATSGKDYWDNPALQQAAGGAL